MNLAANLAALVAGTVAALLVLEVALRIHNPLQTRIKGSRIVLVTRTRARYRNYLTRKADRLDSVITVSRNSLGFRGPDPPQAFADHLTVITIGGSTTRCGMQSDDETWTAHLGERLGASFRDVWINNAGLDGHTTYGHRILLEDYIVRLHPKVALFLVGVNDVIVGPEDDRFGESVRGPLRLGSMSGLLKSLSAHSEVVAVGLEFYRSALAHWAGLGYQQVDLAGLIDYETTAEQQRADREAFAGPVRLAAYGARIGHLIAACRNAGIEPVFLTQPLLVGRGVDDATGRDLGRIRVGAQRNGRTLWELVEAHNDVTRGICSREDVFLIDLARLMPKSSRYYFDFMHFNNDGTVLVATIVDRLLCPHLAGRYPAYVTHPCADSAAATLGPSGHAP